MTDLLTLPDEVVRRLADNHIDLAASHLAATQRGRSLEARAWRAPEIRLDENGNPIFEGYAALWGVPYDVAGGPANYGWVEIVEPGACDKSLREREDVRLLVNHDGVPIARTRSRTLELKADDTGLWSGSTLDATSPLVQTVASAMTRGDLDEMSWAFRVLRQEWNADYTERRILEVQMFDVSIVTYPANPATTAQLRGAEPPEDPPPTRGAYPLTLALAERERLSLTR
ncbi:MAG TPA: HK97 family phage prohead protease [Microthrixaceae bacterium]|jgi:HK97 family phage prohead protease|nr:HK97 family phage prohead protease [Microthrixaceae bacterium]HNH39079.1 HK97 family phage prohead protease [Microthrixaceae bacterium]HNH94419.1 HK97 family phage prohead protease [Microthrixaceae bacterium]